MNEDFSGKYINYFNIDPEYFAQVNEAEIETHPDLWKKFYPHETFVKLLNDTIGIITRKYNRSIWVEGAYGTGKSHAVLTLKKLLDASEEDTKAYFDNFKDQLSTDLFNKFQSIKSGEKKILTVHRYGSSNIHGDNDLIFAIQQSVEAAVKNAGLANDGKGALSGAAVKWLSDPDNKNYFNALIRSNYSELFNGDDTDQIIEKLKRYSQDADENTANSDALQSLMSKIMQVGNERHFSDLTMDATALQAWLEEIVEKNNLKASVFIWDEFTDYFRINLRAMTGFQQIIEFSSTMPFYLIIVTHNVTHLFSGSENKDWKRIMDRFVDPICNIELPENMAFQLMGNAMEENPDPAVQSEWHEIRDDLYDRTKESRELVKKKANIDDKVLKKVLPIHPYAALILKHISSAFDSNQRSMFDFIKNDRGDEIKGFQWFIKEHGPFDDGQELLTIDMLWDFFYEKGKEYLAPSIRAVLDCYSLALGKGLDNDEKRVLKTVLILQAISQQMGNAVDLFIPNDRNINNAFEGTDLEDHAAKIASKMVPDILYRKPLSGGKTQYSALVNIGDLEEVEKWKAEIKKTPTSKFVQTASMDEVLLLDGAMRLRYEVRYASYSDFYNTITQLHNQETSLGNKIPAIMTFARNDEEAVKINKEIVKAISNPVNQDFIFIDASVTPLGQDLLDQYAEAQANANINYKQDRSLAQQYEANAKEVLAKWRQKILEGEFIIYSKDKPEGERVPSFAQVSEYLLQIDKKKYPEGLETHGQVNDTMWTTGSLGMGVECGVTQTMKGMYNGAKLEKYLGEDAWHVDDYWKRYPTLEISKIKIALEDLMQKAFEKAGKISIAEIYEFLADKNGRYGFMPCSLTAFVLGFLLKEYVQSGKYNYSDGYNTDVLNVDKLKDIVQEIIKIHINPTTRYKDKYIVATTVEEKIFEEATAIIFELDKKLCTSVDQTRDQLRIKMKQMDFPLWVLKYILDDQQLQSSKEEVSELIDDYCRLVNSSNYATKKSDSDIAIDIGTLCEKQHNVVLDIKAIANKEKCQEGMIAYLQQYKSGQLIQLATEVEDHGQYINVLKQKFAPDAANWVWNQDTVNGVIDDVIVEYGIIAQSNRVQPKELTYRGAMREWVDRCEMIRISYEYAKSHWADLSTLMALLYDLKRVGVEGFLGDKKQKFLDAITTNGDAFNQFYNDQIGLFKKVNSVALNGLSDDEVKEIFQLMPHNMFIEDKQGYVEEVKKARDKFVNEQGSTKLKKLWRDNTGYDTPRKWSEHYQTPILCMVPDEEVTEARQVFDILNRRQMVATDVQKATDYLEKHNDLFDRLKDQDEIDKQFKNKIVKSYSVLLDDMQEVRSYLSSAVDTEPYDWYGNMTVDNKLKELADYKYQESGCNKALAKIDEMDVADAKTYLKRLIQDNMIVGMEIIKGE